MDDTRQAIVDELTNGKSLSVICENAGLPNRRTVQRWQDDDEEFNAAVTHAREIGFHSLAEKALADAETDTDAALGRLKFDARRWYLGKLSNAFSDNKAQTHVHVDLTDEAKAWLGL